jgi:tetratricopeptide (TPR) repeat protein
LCAERALEVAERSGDPDQIAYMMTAVASVELYTGNWDTCRRLVERSLDLVRPGASYTGTRPRMILGELLLRQGDWDAAERYLEEALTVVRQSNELQGMSIIFRLLAEKDLLQGHPQAALRHRELMPEVPGNLSWVLLELPSVARAHLELGNVDRAAQLVETVLQRAHDQNARLALAIALPVQGLILSKQRQWQEAEETLTEATALARSMPYPFGEASALYEWGRLDAARGEPQLARKHLEAALAIFQRLGARPYVERTERALQELKRRSPT